MRSTPARQGSLREHNLGIVLREVLEAAATGAPPPSRADVAAATGLARATVSALVDRLVASGLVAELEPVPTLRAGRPAVPLAAPSGTLAALGAEVNVDYLGVRVVDLSRAVLVERVVHGDYRGSDPAAVLAELGALVDDAVGALPGHGADVPDGRPVRLAGASLALPGLVDSTAGTLLLAPNLGWREVDVAGLLARSSSVLREHPPLLANEADLAARAEADLRRADGPASFVYVSGEIGIGGAIVLDGQIFGGRHGWAGELGHTVVADGRTLEQVAGQDAMLRAAGLDRQAGVEPLLRAARAGEPAALAALADAATALGVALSNVVNLLDVGHVVLGGTYARLAVHLRAPVLAALSARVLAGPWVPPTVDVARGGNLAAMTGGALAVLGQVVAEPSAWLVEHEVAGAG
ncbi:transcriptional regulator [Cellulomonas chitinilytica]|uniref:Transcriptional regulator n=1 Tax=Cellulomonas chitinilytica TaxID=398759 RepID=A0A919U0N4_9CELL|nr:ROK family transcriptional regulator [Cellulomonas chitinilytica]GIG23075.1 transcriptional regulator [Cellulomonas chitinilytica]